jgi:hypothetical protein
MVPHRINSNIIFQELKLSHYSFRNLTLQQGVGDKVSKVLAVESYQRLSLRWDCEAKLPISKYFHQVQLTTLNCGFDGSAG